jgi:hypothetical protein
MTLDIITPLRVGMKNFALKQKFCEAKILLGAA